MGTAPEAMPRSNQVYPCDGGVDDCGSSGLLAYLLRRRGITGFGSGSTAEEVRARVLTYAKKYCLDTMDAAAGHGLVVVCECQPWPRTSNGNSQLGLHTRVVRKVGVFTRTEGIIVG